MVEMAGAKSGGAVCVCARDLPLEFLSGKETTTLEILKDESPVRDFLKLISGESGDNGSVILSDPDVTL